MLSARSLYIIWPIVTSKACLPKLWMTNIPWETFELALRKCYFSHSSLEPRSMFNNRKVLLLPSITWRIFFLVLQHARNKYFQPSGKSQKFLATATDALSNAWWHLTYNAPDRIQTALQGAEIHNGRKYYVVHEINPKIYLMTPPWIFKLSKIATDSKEQSTYLIDCTMQHKYNLKWILKAQ